MCPHNYPIEETRARSLEKPSFYDPKNFTFPPGMPQSRNRIDQEAAAWSMWSFRRVDDVGRVINPMSRWVRCRPGVATGRGAGLLAEAAIYDKGGQLVRSRSWTIVSHAAGRTPARTFRWAPMSRYPHKPLGVKGCGEGSSPSYRATLINAVVDGAEGDASCTRTFSGDRRAIVVDYPGRPIEDGCRFNGVIPGSRLVLVIHLRRARWQRQGAKGQDYVRFTYQKPQPRRCGSCCGNDPDAKALAVVNLHSVLKQKRLKARSVVVCDDLAKLVLTGITSGRIPVTIAAMTPTALRRPPHAD